MSKNDFKNESEKNPSSYGGFRYRFMYDDFIEAASKEEKRKKSRGRRTFVFTLIIMAAIGLLILAAAVAYSMSAKNNIPEKDSAEQVMLPVDNTVIHGKIVSIGDFSVRAVDPDLSEIYHIPRGVEVTYSNGKMEHFPSGDLLEQGDIIMSVDGGKVPATDDFLRELDFVKTGDTVILEVFRQGKKIYMEYDPKNEK